MVQEVRTFTLRPRTNTKHLVDDSLFNGAGGPTSTLLATCLSHQVTNLHRPSIMNLSSMDAKRRSRSLTLTLTLLSPFITHTRPRLWSVSCWQLQRNVERNYEHICFYRFLQFISKSVVGWFSLLLVPRFELLVPLQKSISDKDSSHGLFVWVPPAPWLKGRSLCQWLAPSCSFRGCI